MRDIWYWLSSNKVHRAEAQSQCREMKELRSACLAVKADTLAAAETEAAETKRKEADGLFDSGEFVKAAAMFKEASGAFRISMEKAQQELRRLAREKMEADTKTALAAFKSDPPRWEEGFRLKDTVNKNDSEIQFFLGYCYANGVGGADKDESAAVEWYRKSAEQGISVAQYNLALMYDKGSGVDENKKEAVKWYRKAAEQGDAKAQYNLAVSYHKGAGIEKDDVESVKWYRKAAEQNFSSAQSNLGFMYAFGYGVEKDYAEAVKWYRKAAEQGHAIAQFFLGNMYAMGKGVAKDIEIAKTWYGKSAAQGVALAKMRLEILSAEKGYLEGLRLTGLDVESVFRDAPTIYISPGDDVEKKIAASPPTAIIVFKRGRYKFSNAYLKGNKRIRGESKESTIIEGVFNSSENHYLMVENMTLIVPETERLKYPVWIKKHSSFVVKNCDLKKGGIRVSGYAKGVISGVAIADTTEWALSINEYSKVYVSKTVASSTNNAMIMFDNSRVVVKDSRLNRESSIGDVVGARHDGALFYIENTVISGGNTGVNVGKECGGCLKNVKFEKCSYSIDNDGFLELYGNTYCGQRFDSGSDGRSVEKENGDFGVRDDIFK